MYCACTYYRGIHSLTDMARRFSVSASALTQARDSTAIDSAPHLSNALKDLEKAIEKT
jgi:hypothetical protein